MMMVTWKEQKLEMREGGGRVPFGGGLFASWASLCSVVLCCVALNCAGGDHKQGQHKIRRKHE